MMLSGVSMAAVARAQSVAQRRTDGTSRCIPSAWVPLGIGIDVEIPPFETDGGGAADIIESRLDGALFGGVAASNGSWLVEGYFIWVAFGEIGRAAGPQGRSGSDLRSCQFRTRDRARPGMTGGVRRLSLKYDIALAELPRLARTPGSGIRSSESAGTASVRKWNGTPRSTGAVSALGPTSISLVSASRLEAGAALRLGGWLQHSVPQGVG